MFTTVVAPTDGSLLSERAIPYARRLALAYNARVVVLRAHLPLDDALPDRMRHIGESSSELAERECARAEDEFHILVQRHHHRPAAEQ